MFIINRGCKTLLIRLIIGYLPQVTSRSDQRLLPTLLDISSYWHFFSHAGQQIVNTQCHPVTCIQINTPPKSTSVVSINNFGIHKYLSTHSLYIWLYIYIHVTFLNSCLYLGQTILSLTAVSLSLLSLLAVLILQCRSLADLYFVPPYYQLIRAETGLSLFIYILISPLLDTIIEIHILPDISYW